MRGGEGFRFLGGRRGNKACVVGRRREGGVLGRVGAVAERTRREEVDHGSVATVPTELLPKLLLLADLREARRLGEGGEEGAHRTYTLAQHAEGLVAWSACLEKGVLPLGDAGEDGREAVQWPSEPVRPLLLGAFARLKLPQLCSRFPQIHKASVRSLLDAVIEFEKEFAEEEEEEEVGSAEAEGRSPSPSSQPSTQQAKVDTSSDKYKRWMAAKQQKGSAGGGGATPEAARTSAAPARAKAPPSSPPIDETKKMDPKYQKWLAAKQAKQGAAGLGGGGGKVATATRQLGRQAPAAKEEETVEEGLPSSTAAPKKWWSGIVEALKEENSEEEGDLEVLSTAVRIADKFYVTWEPAVEALSKAASTFSFVDLLLGSKSDTFDVHNQNSVWRRKGWDKVDGFRQNLEKSKPLRDLVRSLGRGAGWGPLRRSPVQALDMTHGRDGLLRSILEQQETRGLCRSDDLARMLPSEACMLAKGRTNGVAKRLFFAKFVQQSLLSYERDGWHSQPTKVPNPLIREVRPTADRGPILLCIDTSGSMRGVREEVAKALVLECMRAAKEQERGCFVYCFSGPSDVRELELSVDAEGSIDRLLSFLEKVFNGGSDLNEPLKRCMDKLHQAEWSNSDVLIVSDGELRCPQEQLMKQLVGAKDKWNLRVHGVVLPASQVIRAVKKKDKKGGKESQGEAADEVDISVLRTLCTNPTRGGKDDVCVHVFRDWNAFSTDVFAEEELSIQASVNRGKLIEEWRQREIDRLQEQQRKEAKGDKKLRAHPGMKYDKAEKKKKQKDKKLRAFPGMNNK